MRIVNETEEEIVIRPGGSLKLGFGGDYLFREETMRTTASRVKRIVIEEDS